MKNQDYLNKIICDDVKKFLPKLEDNSVDIVLTDPPYFLDKLDNKWDYKKVSNKDNLYVVKSLPAGMKFDKNQGKKFYSWYYEISNEIFRILKPGGFFFSFSSPRLYHRMASAMDDAGFEIRDMFLWLYTQNQAKAMSLNHFIEKLDVDCEQKAEIKRKLNGWKTPQIKSCFEPIAMGQKPTEKTFLNNIMKHNVGLLNTNIKIGKSMYPANVVSTEKINDLIDKTFLIQKPTKKEKGNYNDHKTVKPLTLCEYLINLTAFSDECVILDPFVGSGTTAVAAKKLGKYFIGVDFNKKYVDIAKKRLTEITDIKNNLQSFNEQLELQIV